MTIFLLQAREDPVADQVVEGLVGLDPVRLALGKRPAPFSLTNADVVLVWSAAAQAIGWRGFAALLGRPCALTLIQVEGAQLPEMGGLACTILPWRAGEVIRLKRVYHSHLDGLDAAQRGEGPASAARLAAGVVAALGVMASGAAQPVTASPVIISRRESSERRDAETAQAAPAEVALRAQAGEAGVQVAVRGAIVDLDALLSAELPTHASAAKALVEAMMKPAPVRLAVADGAKRRPNLMLPGMAFRLN